VNENGDLLPDMPARVLPGGEAFNTASALAGWNVPVALTGTALGSDPEAATLRALLDDPALGLPRTLIPDIAQAVTPVCTIRVFPNGEKQMSGRGFKDAVAPPALPAVLLAERPIVAIDPNLGQSAVQAALDAARAGCPVVAMDCEHEPQIVRACRILVTGREWLQRHYRTTLTEADARSLAERLVEDGGAPTAIVTLGEKGCVVADRDAGTFAAPAISVTGVVDTTGAGDTFRAGLCYGLLQHWPLGRTVRFASAAAALHCTVWGGGSRFPLNRVLDLAAEANNEPQPG
jgi:sugar/nucleoside kinase (ribokinase family)